VKDKDLVFMANVDAEMLYKKKKLPPLIVKDISFTSWRNRIVVFIMEETRGIIVIEITRPFSVRLLVHNSIGQLKGGQALDTYDGKSLFAVYKGPTYYEAIEYIVSLDTEQWEVIQTIKSRTKIVDVRVNDDFAVLQGLNHHQV
jgi:hypothetical protein